MIENELLKRIKEYIEDSEDRFENEWGSGNSIETLISNGSMPTIYYEIVSKINEVKE